eukprot:6292783-Pyramimonas_sp.AAC.2
MPSKAKHEDRYIAKIAEYKDVLRENEVDDLLYVCQKKNEVEERLRQLKLEGVEFLNRETVSLLSETGTNLESVCTASDKWSGRPTLMGEEELRMYERFEQDCETQNETVALETGERLASFLRQRAIAGELYDSLEPGFPPRQAGGTAQSAWIEQWERDMGASTSNSSAAAQWKSLDEGNLKLKHEVRTRDAGSPRSVWQMDKPELINLRHTQVRHIDPHVTSHHNL